MYKPFSWSPVHASIVALGLVVGGCSSDDSSGQGNGAVQTGGSAGSSSGTGGSVSGTGGDTSGTGGATTGTGGATGTGGTTDTGGASGTGGSAGADSDAAAPDDAAAGGATGSGGSTGGDAATGAGGDDIGWYEAEAIPPNQLFTTAHKTTCKTACATHADVKEGAACCSAGGEITQILGRKDGALQYNQVMAPADGNYDVTWWYHCGLNDNFGDKDCGGDPSATPSGCRPHQIVVNGTELQGTYHFPCFAAGWAILHACTTNIPLKSGANSIKIYSKAPRDAADMDALEIKATGQGLPPLIKPNSDPIGH
jgi:hypothetical protein